jgi:hypothetical protein
MRKILFRTISLEGYTADKRKIRLGKAEMNGES